MTAKFFDFEVSTAQKCSNSTYAQKNGRKVHELALLLQNGLDQNRMTWV